MSRHAATEPVPETSFGDPFDELDGEERPPDVVTELDELDEFRDARRAAVLQPPAGAFQPIPVVAVAGVDVAAGPDGETMPSLMVVDDFLVRWGRSGLLDQAEPATAQLRLFDWTGLWATTNDLIGQVVTLRWEAVKPSAGPMSVVFFRGRIAGVRPRPKTIQLRDGSRVAGAIVELTAVSLLTDLANIRPAESWPAETLGVRRGRLAAYAASVLPGGVDARDYWEQMGVAPADVSEGTSILDHLITLYDSCGADRMVYSPATQALWFIQRRQFPSARGRGGLSWKQPGDGSDSPRAGRGVYARSHSITVDGVVIGKAMFADARHMEGDPEDGFSRNLASRLTNVAVDYQDQDVAHARRTLVVTVPGAPTTLGQRSATLTTIHAWNNAATTCANDLASIAGEEATEWRLEPLRWSTRRTGGFEHFEQAEFFLQGSEDQTLVFLQGSELTLYGIRPIFAVMGGSIGYARGGWEVEIIPAPISLPLPQHAITWEEIDDGSAGLTVRWYDDDRAAGMHETLTYEDLGYVSTGLGVTVPGPDEGFDQ